MSKEQRERINSLLKQPAGGAPDLATQRANFARMMFTMHVPGGISTRHTALADLPALEVTASANPSSKIILYFHGGSFIQGSPETALSTTGALVERTGVKAVSLDYRLAPENPFPAGVHDCFAAYTDLLDQGYHAQDIILAGDSAGGGLALTTALQARDHGITQPAGVVMFSPGLDATLSGESARSKAGIDPFFSLEGLQANTKLYAPGSDLTDPLLSPAVYADMRGIAPLLLQVGTHELLLDDSTRLAQRARDADVDCHSGCHRRSPTCLSGMCWTVGWSG